MTRFVRVLDLKPEYRKLLFVFIFLLIPFMELLTFEQLVDKSFMAPLWKTILILYSLSRLALSALFIVLYSPKYFCQRTAISVFLFIFLENLASLFNGSLYINYLIGSITFVGMVFVTDWMIKRSRSDFIDAGFYFFGFLSVMNMLTVIIWPNGFFDAPIKDYAIYFLGSKNTAFFYYVLFIYFVILKDIDVKGKPQKSSALWIAMCVVSSYLSSSASALILLFVLLIMYLVWCNYDMIVHSLSFRGILPVIAVIAAFILIEPLRLWFSPLFALVGRNATITGRDYLWLQAIDMFLEHPLWGNGITQTFMLESNVVATHAHSFFLDTLAKYGIFTFLAFLNIVVTAMDFQLKNRNMWYKVLNFIIMIIFLVHSVLDHLMLYNFIFFLCAAECLTRMDSLKGDEAL